MQNASVPTTPTIRWLACMGDSMTCSDTTLYIPKTQQYPHLVRSVVGGNCRERNLGVPGNTTTQMLARMGDMLTPVPTVAVIYGGINDYGTGVSDATTQANLESMIDQLRAAGCQRVVLCNIHAMRDGAADANYNAKRTVIQAVVTTRSTAYCDLHAVTLDVSDYNADGLHLEPSGLQKLADAVKATLDAEGWSSTLQV